MSELEQLRHDVDFYEVIYRQHRVVAYQHLRSLGIREDQFVDIFQEAVIVLFEKTRDPSFQLTCSVRTYLISICRNQFLKRMQRHVEVVSIDGEQTVYNDWLEDEEEIKERHAQLDLLDQVWQTFASVSSKCYELIYRFFYLKESFHLIAELMSYSNADHAKNQKARCQKKLRELYKGNA
jgi:RNA polymerase sigma factor (sigma-70 family)